MRRVGAADAGPPVDDREREEATHKSFVMDLDLVLRPSKQVVTDLLDLHGEVRVRVRVGRGRGLEHG